MPLSAIQRSCALLALLTAGCQHVPPAPIDAAANGVRLSTRSLTEPAVRDALAAHGIAAPADNSWSLDQLTLAAWLLRTDLNTARAEVDATRATTGVQTQRPKPTVNMTNEKVTDSGAANPWVVGAALALTFELGGKREIRRERALANEAAAEWRFGEALWAARAEVRRTWLDVALSRELVALDTEESTLRQGFLTWVETRLRFGAGSTPERLAALQAANESKSRLAQDGAALASARAELAAAIGVPAGELAALEPPPLAALPTLAAADIATARDNALVNRLDVRRALAEYQVAEQELRTAVASQYPDLTLAPGYLHDQADHKITLGLDLPVPLFHNAKPAIREAIAQRAVAAAKFDEVQAAALAAIDIGAARLESTRAALDATELASTAATDAERSMQRRLTAGAADRGEVLTEQIALAGLKRTALDARRAVLGALTTLEDGVEQPLFPASQLAPAASLHELLGSAQ
ncbi:MAG: TolC family protein [Gammaproteobacteria bacterium]